MKLPIHCATDREPIPALERDDPIAGPDLRAATPIKEMIARLDTYAEDDVGYVDLWRRFASEAGISVSANYTPEGERRLAASTMCDAQLRHRSRWLHILTQDLRRDLRRYDLLTGSLVAEGLFVDNRPNNPKATADAIRAFIGTGGRLLINPIGDVETGSNPPLQYTHGTPDERRRCIDATRGLKAVRRRWRSDRQIKITIRLLGTRLDNGWYELAAEPRRATKRRAA